MKGEIWGCWGAHPVKALFQGVNRPCATMTVADSPAGQRTVSARSVAAMGADNKRMGHPKLGEKKGGGAL